MKSIIPFFYESRGNRTPDNLIKRNVLIDYNVPTLIQCSRCPSLYWKQEGGDILESILSFMASVVAGIVANMISKWLDGSDTDN